MPLDTDLLDLLACPSDDHAPLRELNRGGTDVLVCTYCASAYPITDGIPVLLLDEATPGPNGLGVQAPADALPPADAPPPAAEPVAEPVVDDTRLDGAAVPAEIDDAERADTAPDADTGPGPLAAVPDYEFADPLDDGVEDESLGESIDGEWTPRHATEDDVPLPYRDARARAAELRRRVQDRLVERDAGGRQRLRRRHNGRP